ncbi:MAG: formamidopyrimidine-DNA glycosylase [candidate division KSB1 bacterium]|nr:formamidopyrimidine-DNA glycosylase [candidate division KSB1 bacterium]
MRRKKSEADIPEYPDIMAYLAALRFRLQGQILENLRIASPFFLRTTWPRPQEYIGRKIIGFERMGKRIVILFADEMFLVIHLMIAGRLHWRPKGAALSRKVDLAALDFADGTLLITEAGSKKRAAMHLIKGREALAAFERGGLDVLQAGLNEFRERLTIENHTLKRALTDPSLFDGIGNAYSDEILHAAGLSPTALSRRLTPEQIERLYHAARKVLAEWTERLCREAEHRFPEKVTAFRPEMAVHGKTGLPCPSCGTSIARIRFADNETNYCPRCQTGGRLLSDRSLARLLRKDWPKTIDEWEEMKKGVLGESVN